MSIAFFGSSMDSASGDAAATYYRGVLRALADRGHRITLFETDAVERQPRDLAEVTWAEVVVYPETVEAIEAMVERAHGADLVVKASGVGVHDNLLERVVLELSGPRTLVAFWDVDAPATLDRLERAPNDPFRALIPLYDVVLTCGGGAPVVEAYRGHGARRCVPIGELVQTRMLREHTYAHRALDFEAAFSEVTRSRTRSGTWPVASRPLRVVVLGLSITSAWGNGHATTYRGLLRALRERNHDVTFLERDAPQYAQHRDLAEAPYVRIALYTSLDELRKRFTSLVSEADLVIVGSCVPDGVEVGAWVTQTARGATAFYDIDTPLTLADLDADRCTYLSRELVPRYAMYLSSTGGPTLTRIEEELGAPRALPLYCAADLGSYGPEMRPNRWQLGYMGTYSDDRQPALQTLLIEPAKRMPEALFAVAGSQYPSSIEWRSNIMRIDHLEPRAHRVFYNQMAFALNLTRKHMRAAGWSPSVRLFEAAACGVPIISDAWEGIDELFEPDNEILIARDGDDVVRYLTELGDGERRALGARGCARVRAAHTAAHRAADVERYVRELA